MDKNKEEELRLIAEDIMAGKLLTEETVRHLCGRYYNLYFGSYVCRRAVFARPPMFNRNGARTFFAYFLIMDKDFYMLEYRVGNNEEENEYPAQVAVRVYPHEYTRVVHSNEYVRIDPPLEKEHKPPLTADELVECAVLKKELPREEIMRLALDPHNEERENDDFRFQQRDDGEVSYKENSEGIIVRILTCRGIWKVNNNSFYSVEWNWDLDSNILYFRPQPMIEVEPYAVQNPVKYHYRKKG